jgi:hypothetical protein
VGEQGGAETVYFVEPARARRLYGWTRSDGERAQLRGSERLVYWETHNLGDERLLEKLGLRPREPSLAEPTAPRPPRTRSPARLRDLDPFRGK